MKVEIYVQARMGSTRLPGKVMMKVLDKPLLGFLIERLRQSKEVNGIAILTTTEAADDEIAKYCQKEGIYCFRGSEEDVLSRYYQTAVLRNPDAIVRVTADCPLIDPDVIDLVVHAYRSQYPLYDYVSNVMERTYPRGLDVEIFSKNALKQAYQHGQASYEKEHVTPYFYLHPELFHLGNVACAEMLGDHRWTVDTPEDFTLIKLILEHVYPSNPTFRMADVLDLLAEYPEWVKINAHVEQKKLR